MATPNPFIINTKLNVIQRFSTLKLSGSIDGDDTTDLSLPVKSGYYIEQQNKTSVYEMPNIEDILYNKNITSKGRDLLLYIVYNIRINSDTINLNSKKVCDSMNISRPTLAKSISELRDAGFISNNTQSVYWINPFYIFKGNKIAFYKENYPNQMNVVARYTEM